MREREDLPDLSALNLFFGERGEPDRSLPAGLAAWLRIINIVQQVHSVVHHPGAGRSGQYGGFTHTPMGSIAIIRS